MAFHRVWAGALIVLMSASALQAKPIREFNVAGWDGGAYADDQTGAFSHCAISAHYQSGVFLLFMVDREYRWAMGFANPDWQLTPGETYDLTYSIDGRGTTRAKGIAINEIQVRVPLVASSRLFNRFRHGYRMKVFTAGRTMQFNLTGTSRALATVLDCTKRYEHYVAALPPSAPGANPFAPQSGGRREASRPEPSGSEEAWRAEATTLLANLLSSAQIRAFSIIPRNEYPDELATYHAVWSAPGVIGAVKVVSADGTPTDISATLIAGDARECKGRFASGTTPGEDSGGAVSAVFAACDAPDNQWTIYYSIMRRASGGFYVLSILPVDSDGAAAKQAERDIRRAAVAISAR